MLIVACVVGARVEALSLGLSSLVIVLLSFPPRAAFVSLSGAENLKDKQKEFPPPPPLLFLAPFPLPLALQREEELK